VVADVVQNKKLPLAALPFVIALNNTDLPTPGNPTMPHLTAM
jgi:hypothetical protein